MTPRQFRSSPAWKRARRQAVHGARYCAICSEPLRFDLGWRHALAPSVDHVIPLAHLDLTLAEHRRMAVDPSMLRVVHVRCNSRRGATVRRRVSVADPFAVMEAPVPRPRRSQWW